MKQLYFILAIVGAIIPQVFFAQFIMIERLDLPKFASALFAIPAASGFISDLLFTSFVFWMVMFVDRHKTKNTSPSPHISIVLNLVIGLLGAVTAQLSAREIDTVET